MRQTDKSLQSEKFKQVVGGLGKPLGKSPAPDRLQSPRDLDRSFPCWPGSGYFGMARGGVLYTAEGPRPFQLSDPRPPHRHTCFHNRGNKFRLSRDIPQHPQPPLQKTKRTLHNRSRRGQADVIEATLQGSDLIRWKWLEQPVFQGKLAISQHNTTGMQHMTAGCSLAIVPFRLLKRPTIPPTPRKPVRTHRNRFRASTIPNSSTS